MFLMDEKRLKELVKEGTDVYNGCGRTIEEFNNWEKSFEGTEDYSVVNSFCNLIRERRNGASAFLFNIYPSLEKELYKKLLSNISPQ